MGRGNMADRDQHVLEHPTDSLGNVVVFGSSGRVVFLRELLSEC